MREVPNLQKRINWTKYAQLQYVLLSCDVASESEITLCNNI